MSLRANLNLRPAWENEGTGLVWLVAGFAVTVVLGLALQLAALRTLTNGGYATFVFALGIGNVAAAIAAAIQPVVALRIGSARPAFLPLPPVRLLVGALLVGAVATAALAPSVGLLVATFACLQVPLNALAAVGLGRLQAGRCFARLAGLAALLALIRIVVVLPGVFTETASPLAFVLALPAGLLGELVVLAALGGFRGLDWQTASDGSRLLGNYALWALFGWLLNADAVFARLYLARSDADAYALAVTLGRQPLYAVAPLAMVLLPVTLGSHPNQQRSRLRAIALVSALLLVATLLVLGPWPRAVVSLLTGDDTRGNSALIRGYAVVGSLGAAATLLLTFAFALGRPPRVRAMALLTAVSGLLIIFIGQRAVPLLALQTAVVATLTLSIAYLGVRATAVPSA